MKQLKLLSCLINFLLAFSFPNTDGRPVLDLSSPREKAVLTSSDVSLNVERSIEGREPEEILSRPAQTSKPKALGLKTEPEQDFVNAS